MITDYQMFEVMNALSFRSALPNEKKLGKTAVFTAHRGRLRDNRGVIYQTAVNRGSIQRGR